jgi:ribosome-associated protein
MQNVPIALSAIDPARARTHALDAESTARRAAEAALEKKADDVVLVDLRGKATYADFLVICSGTNERQLEAVADSVESSLRQAGQRLIGSEGGRGGRWVLLDFGDVVVHVFHQEERAYYDLEGLWSDAPMTRP